MEVFPDARTLDAEAKMSAQQASLDAIIAGDVQPIAKCVLIEVVGYGITARHPRIKMKAFITVGGPRMQIIWGQLCLGRLWPF